MALDPETGLDPPGIRIRPAQGLEAADQFMGSFFWVRCVCVCVCVCKCAFAFFWGMGGG